MTKDRSPFCFPENIAGEMRALFARLHGADLRRGKEAKAFAEEAAAFLAYLNAIHPFREGNGRTQLTFTALLAAESGHPLKLSRLDPARFLQAMIACACFHRLLIRPQPHPEEALRAVSKGGIHYRCCPSFETPRFARLLRMRLSVNQQSMKAGTSFFGDEAPLGRQLRNLVLD